MPDPGELTRLLHRWGDGSDVAFQQLVPLAYDQLQRLARVHLARERSAHTLDSGALVHESFMRLNGLGDMAWRDRTHFYAMAARMMRRVLVDHARARSRQKRSGIRVPFNESALGVVITRPDDLVALDEALDVLAAEDPDLADFVQLRYFGGMTHAEIAEAKGVSVPTVRRRLRFAHAYLQQELQER